MANKDEAAFPVHADTTTRTGLSKREYIAAMAMQGLLSLQDKGIECKTYFESYQKLAEHAVMVADALLAELEK